MKKTILFVAAVATMLSCSKQIKVQEVSLTSENDSINYTFGIINGVQIKNQFFPTDSSETPILEFVEAMDEAFNNKEFKEPSEYEKVGKQFADFFKQQAKEGVANNKAWKYNNNFMLQGFVNGLYGYNIFDSTFVAQTYFQEKYSQTAGDVQPEKASESKVKANCPKKAGDMSLETEIDSINYICGYINGKMVATMMPNFSQDSIEIIVDNLNEELSSGKKYPMLVNVGQSVGHSLAKDEYLLTNYLFDQQLIARNYDLIRAGFINGMLNDDKIISVEESNMYLNTAVEKKRLEACKPNQLAGEKFLAENALREGVHVTESGLQYEILEAGKGHVHPADTSRVKVHYHGTLIDGKVFDSSVERGEPATFGLNQVIRGWTEGVQLMVEGDKFRFYIPYQLAYGERGAGQDILPYSALIFDVELIEIVK